MKDDSRSVIYRQDINTVDGTTGEVTSSSSRRLSKVSRTPEFIMLYTKHIAFLEHLNKSETTILFELLSKYIGMGNLILLSPPVKKTIVKKLEVDDSYINRAIRGLKKKLVIIQDENIMLYLNPEFFGKGNWEDIQKMRHEIAYDFDFNTLEVSETRKLSTAYDKDFDMNDHEVIDQQEFKDEVGTLHQEITVAENIHPKQAVIEFDELEEHNQNNDLIMLQEQNKSKELAIEEMKLKLEMKKEGLL